MMGSLKSQLNLLAVAVILAVSLLISLAAVVAMDRLAHQLSAARMLSELSWIRFDVGDTHRILKDTGVDAIKSYLESAQQEIIRKFRDFRIGVTGRLYLVSDDGRIVSVPSDRQATDLDEPALELVIREKVGHANLMIAGSPSIVYFDNFPEWRWRILLTISEKEINADRDNFILMAILIMLFSACAGVFVFAWVANGFVLPILELAKKLSGMKEDQLGQQIEVKHRSKEVGILLSAFRRLSNRLLLAKNTLQEQNEELRVRRKELQSQNDELISAGAMLQQSEQRHRSILQTAMDGIFFLDMQGYFVEANKTYCRMSGYSIQELLTMSIPDVEYFETASDTAAHIKKIMEQGEDRFESQHRRKDGSIYDVEVSVQYRSAEGGQFVVFLRDITEQKQADIEREKLQEQLNQSQKMESVGRLAGGVAHDFNNMLGVILGHTELALLQADENNDLYSDLKEIQKAAKRSADTTKQLLAFARKDIISPKQIDLNNTVESMLNMLRRLIGENIDLVWKPAVHLWPTKMDPSQIDQILANLCVNARDAISGAGKLTIETEKQTFDEEYCKEHPGFIPGDFVQLTVSDNGCGMDKETLTNLFEPFFTTKEIGKGTGLGLATIYGIVKQNNGFINVYSEPGQGSTFKIYLPRLVAEKEIDKAVPEKKAAAGGIETILLVEDEPNILRMTRMMLEKKGYSVLSAATPVEAIEMARNHTDKIHLLMSDVVMPEINGRDLAGKITELYPDIRLLFMSGYTADVIAHQGVLDDGVAFIQKPFSMEDMTEKVREILDKSC